MIISGSDISSSYTESPSSSHNMNYSPDHAHSSVYRPDTLSGASDKNKFAGNWNKPPFAIPDFYLNSDIKYKDTQDESYTIDNLHSYQPQNNLPLTYSSHGNLPPPNQLSTFLPANQYQ